MQIKEAFENITCFVRKLAKSLTQPLLKTLNSNGSIKQLRGYLEIRQEHELLSHKTLSLNSNSQEHNLVAYEVLISENGV